MNIRVSKALVNGFSRSVIAAIVPLGLLAQSPGPGMSERTALRIQEQATWGPTPAMTQSLQTWGFNAWFQDQTTTGMSPIPDQPLLGSDGKTNTNIAPMQAAFYANTLNGNDQLRQRVAFALSEIWVVSNIDLTVAAAQPPLLRIFQMDAFGNYLTLMKHVTVNPAMGHYLDMANNDKATSKSAANENYARELMQLFTLGLAQLNLNGTPVLNNGVQVPTFTQDTVTNLARMFTGWTYAPAPGAVNNAHHNPIYYLSPMVERDAYHDSTAKSVFGVNVSSGTNTDQDLDLALNTIFNQPSMAPFISMQLIQHLVTSNPSPAYVSRVASVFNSDVNGVRGNLKSVIYQILTDPEARAGDTQPFTAAPSFGHYREPVLFIANLLRGLGATLTASSSVQSYANNLGQNLFNAPSVFSYFPPDYQTNGITAPELSIYNTQTSVGRTGVVNTAIFGGQLDANTKFNPNPFITAASSTGQAQFFTLVNQTFFHDDMSNAVKTAMQTAMAAVTAPADKAKAGLYIALTSSEYQVIH